MTSESVSWDDELQGLEKEIQKHIPARPSESHNPEIERVQAQLREAQLQKQIAEVQMQKQVAEAQMQKQIAEEKLRLAEVQRKYAELQSAVAGSEAGTDLPCCTTQRLERQARTRRLTRRLQRENEREDE